MSCCQKTNADLVLPTVFSQNGLADSSFLPYATSAIQGRFRHNAVRGSAAVTSYTTSEQYNFYQSASTSKLPSDTNPYALANFRNTPDARVIEQGEPGSAWQPGTSHTVRNQKSLSTSTSYPVLQWNASGTTSGYYPNNTVWVTTVTDENNHIVNVYRDKQGHLVLKQAQADASTWLLTYYIYDTYGQLIYKIPPKAMAVLGNGTSLNANSSSIASLIYKYSYDERGRLIEKIVPGSAVQWTVYDQLDRVALTQDANQRALGVWMFVKYDYKNRPVYFGQMASTSTRSALQAQFDAINYSTQPYYETATANATYQGYSNTVFPTTGLTVLAAYYYDNYDFDRNGSPDYTYDNTQLTGLPTQASSSTRGLSTGSKKLIMGTSNWLSTYVFYDNLDRPLQTLSNNHLNLTLQDKTSVLYFANNVSAHVQQIKMVHVGTTTVNVIQRYTYDNGWRTTGIYHTINSNAEQQLAAYAYNALGELISKKLHVTGTNYLQCVDMRYNIRGWLTSINNAQLTNDGGVTNNDSNDYFGMELFYNTAEPSGLGNSSVLSYNGNISAQKWKGQGTAPGPTDQRGYVYTYDYSDRLLSAAFQANSGSAWNKESNTLNESMTYDANGNILKLLRNKNSAGVSFANNTISITSTPSAIDSLTYSYQSGNQLSKVNDSGTHEGFSNGVNTGADYTYDSTGNLTADANKLIDSVKYNILGKPVRIKYHNGNLVTYIYDALGIKQSMKSTHGDTTALTVLTDYVGGFVYTNDTLRYFSCPEGRVINNFKTSSFEYQYAITDHLGNTRVVFTSAPQTTQSVTATFESAAQATEAREFLNYPSNRNINVLSSNNHTTGGTYSEDLNGGYLRNSEVGVAKSYAVFPGDQLQIGAWARYNAATTSTDSVADFAVALISAFQLPAYVSGEIGTPTAALNTWGAIEAGGFADGSTDNTDVKAFVTIILFDKNYNFLDFASEQVNSSGALSYISASYTVKEAGYAFMYVSNENKDIADVFFDDVTMSYTPSAVLQYNEYYPFGLQAANSWTRPTAMANNYLANGGTEMNTTTKVYDLDFRNYDPALGRMNQVDPMADKYGSLSPYHFALNNPVTSNDPNGADPPFGAIAYGQYDPGPTGDLLAPRGGTPRSDGNGGYYLDANGNGQQDEGEIQVGYYEVQQYYNQYITPYTPQQVLQIVNNAVAEANAAYNRQLVGWGSDGQMYGAQGEEQTIGTFGQVVTFVQVDSQGNRYVPYTNQLYYASPATQEGATYSGNPYAQSGPWVMTIQAVLGFTQFVLDATSYSPALRAAATATTLKLGLFGAAVTIVQGVTNKDGWQNHNTADLAIGLTLTGASYLAATTTVLAFVPGVNLIIAGIGIAYFATDLAVQILSNDHKSITEKLLD